MNSTALHFNPFVVWLQVFYSYRRIVVYVTATVEYGACCGDTRPLCRSSRLGQCPAYYGSKWIVVQQYKYAVAPLSPHLR